MTWFRTRNNKVQKSALKWCHGIPGVPHTERVKLAPVSPGIEKIVRTTQCHEMPGYWYEGVTEVLGSYCCHHYLICDSCGKVLDALYTETECPLSPKFTG